MKYEFHPEAEQELYEAASRYESEVTELGCHFADEVEHVIRLLLEHPERRQSTLRQAAWRSCRNISGGLLCIAIASHRIAEDALS